MKGNSNIVRVDFKKGCLSLEDIRGCINNKFDFFSEQMQHFMCCEICQASADQIAKEIKHPLMDEIEALAWRDRAYEKESPLVEHFPCEDEACQFKFELYVEKHELWLTKARQHPTEEELSAFFSGKLDKAEKAEISKHLKDCNSEACKKRAKVYYLACRMLAHPSDVILAKFFGRQLSATKNEDIKSHMSSCKLASCKLRFNTYRKASLAEYLLNIAIDGGSNIIDKN